MDDVQRSFANGGNDSRRINREQNLNLEPAGGVTVYRITRFFWRSNWKSFQYSGHRGSQEKTHNAAGFMRTEFCSPSELHCDMSACNDVSAGRGRLLTAKAAAYGFEI
jgi:hypothetical protein